MIDFEIKKAIITFPRGDTKLITLRPKDRNGEYKTCFGTFVPQPNGEYWHCCKLDGTWTLRILMMNK